MLRSLYVLLIVIALVSCKEGAPPVMDTSLVENSTYNDAAGDLVLQDGGNALWYNQPNAVYYKGKFSRTYIGWLNRQHNQEIMYFDDSTQFFSKVKKVCEWGFDDHGTPVVHVVQQGSHKGKVCMFFSRHNGHLFFTRSVTPEEIDSFEAIRVVDSGNCVYPSVLETRTGRIMLFYNRNINDTDGRWTRALYYRYSDNGGENWSRETELINFGHHTWIYYVTPYLQEDTLHLAFSLKDSVSEKVQHLFYLKSPDKGSTWADIHSRPLSMPVSDMQAIYTSPTGLETRVWDLTVQNGMPKIAFMNYDSAWCYAYTFRYTGTRWQTVPAGKSRRVYYPTGIVIDDSRPDHIFVTESRKNKNAIAEKMYHSATNNYQLVSYISRDTLRHQVRPQMIGNYNRLQMIWHSVHSYDGMSDYNVNLKSRFIPKQQINK